MELEILLESFPQQGGCGSVPSHQKVLCQGMPGEDTRPDYHRCPPGQTPVNRFFGTHRCIPHHQQDGQCRCDFDQMMDATLIILSDPELRLLNRRRTKTLPTCHQCSSKQFHLSEAQLTNKGFDFIGVRCVGVTPPGELGIPEKMGKRLNFPQVFALMALLPLNSCHSSEIIFMQILLMIQQSANQPIYP